MGLLRTIIGTGSSTFWQNISEALSPKTGNGIRTEDGSYYIITEHSLLFIIQES